MTAEKLMKAMDSSKHDVIARDEPSAIKDAYSIIWESQVMHGILNNDINGSQVINESLDPSDSD
jgi:hypothetical protein